MRDTRFLFIGIFALLLFSIVSEQKERASGRTNEKANVKMYLTDKWIVGYRYRPLSLCVVGRVVLHLDKNIIFSPFFNNFFEKKLLLLKFKKYRIIIWYK